jgi:hypothetical protein
MKHDVSLCKAKALVRGIFLETCFQKKETIK